MPLRPDAPTTWRDLLIVGPPDQGKTQSLTTFPRDLYLISCPRESGHATIPSHIPTIHLFTYPLDYEKPISWGAVCDQVDLDVTQILDGKHGKVEGGTLALDGLHKLYEINLYKNSGGVLAQGGEVDGRKLYPATNHPFFLKLQRWRTLALQRGMYFVCTCWIAPDKDDPNDQKSLLSHDYPALAGQAGRNLVGEFSVKLRAFREGEGTATAFKWRTVTDHRTWGIGIKGPVEMVGKVPAVLPQRWPELAKYLVVPQ